MTWVERIGLVLYGVRAVLVFRLLWPGGTRPRWARLAAIFLSALWPLAYVMSTGLALKAEIWPAEDEEFAIRVRYGCGHGCTSNFDSIISAKRWWHAFRNTQCRRDGLPFAKLVIEAVLRRRIWSKRGAA